MAIEVKRLDVRLFGAKSDATQAAGSAVITGTDNSAAFARAVAFITSTTTRRTQYSEQGVRYILYVPAGRYIIKSSGILIPPSYTTPAIAGYTVEGDGRDATEIIYIPTTAGTFLCDNQNGFQNLTFRGITFTSTGELDGVLNHSFMRMRSQNQGQNYIFEDCNWGGGWKYIWYLVGINTNSECTFRHCGIYNAVLTAFYIPPYNGSDDSISGSDQMVNYNFYDCQFEVWKGNYFRLDAGGNVNIYGGSIINTSGVGPGDGTTNNTFFKLGLAANSTNQGTYRLHVQGVRFEMRGSTNTKVIECDWPFGHVTFLSCDMGLHSWVSGVPNITYVIFNFKGNNGPCVQFINCNTQGKHQYKFDSNGHTARARVTYNNCEMWNQANPDEFITLTNTSGTNRGGAPLIEFIKCKRGSGAAGKNLWDHVMNWHNNTHGETNAKILNISTADNLFPRSTNVQDFYLPLNSMILSVTVKMAAGEAGVTTAGWQYYVRTSEGSPTTLATITPISDNPSLGISQKVVASPLPYFCDTDAKRHIVVTSNGTVNDDVRGFFLIEYL